MDAMTRNRDVNWVAHCRANVSHAISTILACSRAIVMGRRKSYRSGGPFRWRRAVEVSDAVTTCLIGRYGAAFSIWVALISALPTFSSQRA